MTIDEFKEAWYLKKAKVKFKDGQILTGYALYISASDSPDDVEEIDVINKSQGIACNSPLSEVESIEDLS